jgi:hypothetical protein
MPVFYELWGKLLQPLPDSAGHNAFMPIYKVNQRFSVNDIHSGCVFIFSLNGKQENLISVGG